MTKKISPIEGFASLMEVTRDQILGRPVPGREDFLRADVGDQIVDTVCAFDTGEWETGIKRGHDWVIVQQYDDRAAAVAGHSGWVERLTADPEMELKDLDLWGMND